MTVQPLHVRDESIPLAIVRRGTDVAAILGGALVAWKAAAPMEEDQFPLLILATLLAFTFTSRFVGLYRSWRGVAGEREITCVLGAWVLAIVALVIVGLATRSSDSVPRSVVAFWAGSTAVFLAAARIGLRHVVRHLRRSGLNGQRFAIVGVTPIGIQLARNVEAAAELGLTLAGFYDDRPVERLTNLPPDVGSRLGNLDDLYRAVAAGEVQRVYITFPMRAEKRIAQILDRLSDTTASVFLVPDFFVFELLHSRWTNIRGVPVVSVFDHPFYGVDGWIKRATDLVLASLALVMLSPVFVAIAAAVKLSSPGPVFFRQVRYGLDGRQIRVWKFRSMTVCENGPTIAQATRGDKRITPVGAILRKTSLDELPQLFNVLVGEMSLVGPRPHAAAHNEEYRTMIQGYMLRHKVRPGITGLAQVMGYRGETDTLDKMAGRVKYDHAYIRDWSWWLDVRILFQTVGVVFSQQNAY